VVPELLAINDSWLWFIFFTVMAAAGIMFSYRSNVAMRLRSTIAGFMKGEMVP
jgi:hypothetical protein